MKTRRTRRGGVRVVYARVVLQRPSACWSRAGDENSHAAGPSTVTVTRERTRRRPGPDTVIPAMPSTARRSREPIRIQGVTNLRLCLKEVFRESIGSSA